MKKQKNSKRLLCLLLFFTCYQVVAVAQPKPITVGLLPYLSLKTLVKKWGPLIKYLELELKRPVIITSAKDFKSFIARAKNEKYDIYYTAPHFAALAESQKTYERLVGFDKKLRGDVVIHKDSSYKNIMALKNKRVVTPDRLAIITLLGERFLEKNGLIPNQSVFMYYLKSHSKAIHAVAHKQADAAIVVGGLINRVPYAVSENLRLLATTEDIPHTMIMLKNSLAVNDKHRIKAAFAKFHLNTKYSKPFFKNVGFGRFQKIPDSDINYFNKIIPTIIKRLNEKSTKKNNLTEQD